MENLTKDGFLTSVFDYEHKSEWDYQGRLPCIIEFHDDGCPPCRALAPVLDELSKQYANRVTFYRVDMSQESVLADELGVKNLPTLVLCPVDEKPIVFQGAASKDKLEPIIEKELLKVEAGADRPDSGGISNA